MNSNQLYIFIAIVILAVGFIPFKVLIHVFRKNKKNKNESK